MVTGPRPHITGTLTRHKTTYLHKCGPGIRLALTFLSTNIPSIYHHSIYLLHKGPISRTGGIRLRDKAKGYGIRLVLKD